MIQANEIRIGNYVYLLKNGIKKIYQIGGGYDIYKVDESNCIDIEPIPLTEDVFLKIKDEEFKYFFNYNKASQCYTL